MGLSPTPTTTTVVMVAGMGKGIADLWSCTLGIRDGWVKAWECMGKGIADLRCGEGVANVRWEGGSKCGMHGGEGLQT